MPKILVNLLVQAFRAGRLVTKTTLPIQLLGDGCPVGDFETPVRKFFGLLADDAVVFVLCGEAVDPTRTFEAQNRLRAAQEAPFLNVFVTRAE